LCRTQAGAAANFISDDEDAHHASQDAAADDNRTDKPNSRVTSPAAERRPVERKSMFV